jgi:flagellar hook-associated protein 2
MAATGAIGGGAIDVNGIVSQLMKIERRPLDALEKRENDIRSRLSAFGRVQGALAALESALSRLQAAGAFDAARVGASGDGVAATAAAGAAPGRYEITVTALARAQSSASGAFAGASSSIGSGTFTIRDAQGATVAAIAMGGAGEPQTVSELRDAINAAGAGVRASLLTDGSGTRLLLTAAETGLANAFTVETTGAPASSLAALTGAPAQAAADAEFSLNGLALSSASNRLPGLIEGLTIELKRAQPGVPVEVTVERDIDSARAAVADFVKAYNDARRLLDDLTKYDPAARSAAVLNGESVLRQVQSQLRSALSGSRSAAAGEYTRLSEVGVEFQADGSLKLDDSRFRAAAAAGLDKVARLFAASSSSPDERGFAVRLKAVVKSFVDADGALSGRQEGLRASIRTLDAQQERWEARLALIEKRLRDQYSRLDALVAINQSRSNALANALAALPRRE